MFNKKVLGAPSKKIMNIDVYINVRIGEHSLVVVVVNITTINCHLLGWCGCWRPAAH